ncbi:hypothetical protein BH11VER1_BH11VER1_29860 [soil metagenome]
MKTSIYKRVLAIAAFAAMGLLTSPSAQAVVTYSQGDLLMGFRKVGFSDVVINIGSAGTLYRDAASNFTVTTGDLGGLLTTNFGATWYSDSSLLWGVFGSPNATGANATLFNGDFGKTIYVSKEQTTIGTQSTPLTDAGGTLFTGTSPNVTTRNGASADIATLQTAFAARPEAPSNAFATIWDPATVNAVASDWTDAVTGFGRSGLAFNTFTPGAIQGGDALGLQNNGLDLYRVTGNSAGANGGGIAGYEGTFFIDNTGAVTFSTTPSIAAVPEPSRAVLLAAGLCSLVLRRRRRIAVQA